MSGDTFLIVLRVACAVILFMFACGCWSEYLERSTWPLKYKNDDRFTGFMKIVGQGTLFACLTAALILVTAIAVCMVLFVVGVI